MLSYETVKEADVTLVTAPTAHESRPPGIAGLQRHARRSDDEDLAAVAGPVMNEEQKRSAATMVPEPQIRFQKSSKDQ